MPSPSRRRSFRPLLEQLEYRETPAVLTTTYSAATHTLTVVGTADANDVAVSVVAPNPNLMGRRTEPMQFMLTSSADTFASGSNTYTSPRGVLNLVFKMQEGDDSIVFQNTIPMRLAGSLSIDGGDGANHVAATDLSVVGSLSIVNGRNDVGFDTSDFINLAVGKTLDVNNGDGNSLTAVSRSRAGFNSVKSIRVTNGIGQDYINISQTNVLGDVTVTNGRGDASGVAGSTLIGNGLTRAVIRGNVTVSYLDGDGTAGWFDRFADMDVRGNMSIDHGSGNFTTYIGGDNTTAPVLIHGNLLLTGGGAQTVGRGVQSGFKVGGNFTTMFGASLDRMGLFNIEVSGNTSIDLGDGENSVSMVDSKFQRDLTVSSGVDADQLYLGQIRIGRTATFILGDGANSTGGSSIVVGRDFRITHGIHTVNVNTSFGDMTVGGAFIVNNGEGDSQTTLARGISGFNSIGSILIQNGAGSDSNWIRDTNVRGDVTVINGKGDAGGSAGMTFFQNQLNTSKRSVIGGSVTVSYVDGETRALDGIFDAEVRGNVTFHEGSGHTMLNFEGYNTTLPVLIGGNLLVTGTGTHWVFPNSQYQQSGLFVGGNVTMSLGDGDDVVSLAKTTINGELKLNLGDGMDKVDLFGTTAHRTTNVNLGEGDSEVRIQNASFAGPFWLASGAGQDTVQFWQTTLDSLDLNLGDGIDRVDFGRTTVCRTTKVNLGEGDSQVYIEDSYFGGAFWLASGAGRDIVWLEYNSGTTGATQFRGPVVIEQGDGDDDVMRIGADLDSNQKLVIYSTFIIRHGTGNDTTSTVDGHEFYPFGNFIEWIV